MQRFFSIVTIAASPSHRRVSWHELLSTFVDSKDAQRDRSQEAVVAERTLQHAPWPGNVRELRNVIERACLLSDGKMLNERDVLAAMPSATEPPRPGVSTEAALPASGSALDPNFLTNAQRAQVEQALREARGNKAAAARLLGISRRSMYRWLDRFDRSQPTAPTEKD